MIYTCKKLNYTCKRLNYTCKKLIHACKKLISLVFINYLFDFFFTFFFLSFVPFFVLFSFKKFFKVVQSLFRIGHTSDCRFQLVLLMLRVWRQVLPIQVVNVESSTNFRQLCGHHVDIVF